MHLSFKSVCNKEHKGVICNMTSSSNSFQSTQDECLSALGRITSFLDFTRNYKRTSEIFATAVASCILTWHIRLPFQCDMLGKFFPPKKCLMCSADFFLKLTFDNNLSGIPSECQTVWILIRPDNLLGLIRIQTVCKFISR